MLLHLILTLILFFTAVITPASGDEDDLYTSQDVSLADADISGDKIRVFLIAETEATISSEVDGKIISLPYVMGETFKKGDTLVELDSELALAAKDKAEKELEAATTNLDAIKDLRSRDDATLVELKIAEKDQAVAQAGLILARKNLSMCRINAPFSGRVIKVEKNEHELASSREPLISIINDNTLLAHFLLPISSFPATRIGDEIEVTIPLVDRSFTAKISRISATLDAASGTFEVAADIDNSAQLLRAGMSGWFSPLADDTEKGGKTTE